MCIHLVLLPWSKATRNDPAVRKRRARKMNRLATGEKVNRLELNAVIAMRVLSFGTRTAKIAQVLVWAELRFRQMFRDVRRLPNFHGILPETNKRLDE